MPFLNAPAEGEGAADWAHPETHHPVEIKKTEADRLDYTDKYNTALSSDEESGFQDWIARNSAVHGRNLSHDLYDYDLRGQYKDSGGVDIEPGHGTDRYKKPNHPTFSNESVYHGTDGHEGGAWAEENGKHNYTPSRTNLEMRSPAELQKYFDEVEPDIELKLPPGKTSHLMRGVTPQDEEAEAFRQKLFGGGNVDDALARMKSPKPDQEVFYSPSMRTVDRDDGSDSLRQNMVSGGGIAAALEEKLGQAAPEPQDSQ